MSGTGMQAATRPAIRCGCVGEYEELCALASLIHDTGTPQCFQRGPPVTVTEQCELPPRARTTQDHKKVNYFSRISFPNSGSPEFGPGCGNRNGVKGLQKSG